MIGVAVNDAQLVAAVSPLQPVNCVERTASDSANSAHTHDTRTVRRAGVLVVEAEVKKRAVFGDSAQEHYRRTQPTEARLVAAHDSPR